MLGLGGGGLSQPAYRAGPLTASLPAITAVEPPVAIVAAGPWTRPTPGHRRRRATTPAAPLSARWASCEAGRAIVAPIPLPPRAGTRVRVHRGILHP